MKKIFSLILVAVLSMSVSGCAVFNSVKSPKVAPMTKQQSAEAYVSDFAHGLGSVQALEIQAFRQGEIEKEYHIAIQKVFKQIGDEGPLLSQAVQVGGGTLQQEVDKATALLQSAQAQSTLHIKNTATQAAVKVLIDNMANTLKLILTAGGK